MRLSRDNVASNAAAIADYLGLTTWARQALPDGANVCAPGRAIWQVGSRINLVEHIRTATEIRLTDTNRRMSETSSAAADDTALAAAPLIRLRAAP